MKPLYALIVVFGTAFGYIEAAVVVYLRRIFYPEGFSFPLKAMTPDLVTAEIVREVATLALLASASAAAGRRISEKIAYFLLSFAVWDITYYFWLKVLINWPASFFDWDILFLIPVPWTAPVIAPVIVSLSLIAWAVLLLQLGEKREKIKVSAAVVVLLALSAAVIKMTFFWNAPKILAGQSPEFFPWLLFAAGILFSFAAMAWFVKVNTENA